MGNSSSVHDQMYGKNGSRRCRRPDLVKAIKNTQNAKEQYRQGNFIQAIKSAQKAETLLLQTTDPEETLYLNLTYTWSLLGGIRWRQGDLDQALHYYKRCMDVLIEKDTHSSVMGTVLQNMGCVFLEQHKDSEALLVLQAALKIKQCHEPDSLTVAHTHHNIAIVLARFPQHRQNMLDHFSEAVKIKEEKAPNTESLAGTYLTFGSVCNSARHLELVQKAHDIARKLSRPSKVLMVNIHESMGLAYAKEGKTRDLGKAIELLEKAKALERNISPTSLKYASINANLAIYLEEYGRLEEAREARTTALSLEVQKAPSRLEPQKKDQLPWHEAY